MTLKKYIHGGRLFWLVLMLCHVALMLFLYRSFGINILNEGDKYLSEARNLIRGEISLAFEHQHFYAVYIIYLSFFLFCKVPVTVIFVCTYLLSLLSYFLFYKALKELISSATAKIWIALVLLSPMLQFWQFNLFSETFFIALSLIFISIVVSQRTKRRTINLFLLSLLLIFSRPTGIFMVLAFFCYSAWPNKFSLKERLSASFAICILIFIAFIFFMPLHYKGIAYEVASGSIYCGIPTLMPTTLSPGDYTLAQCYKAIIHDQSVTTLGVLFFKKFFSFFITTRPHYSSLHNFINGAHTLFYLFAASGIYLSLKHRRVKLFFTCLLIIILLNALLVGLVFNEWTERYTVQVFPFIFVFAAYSISLILIKVRKHVAF